MHSFLRFVISKKIINYVLKSLSNYHLSCYTKTSFLYQFFPQGNVTAPEISVTDSSDKPVSPSPKKGILKRRNSFSLGTTRTLISSPAEAVYQTITVGDTR